MDLQGYTNIIIDHLNKLFSEFEYFTIKIYDSYGNSEEQTDEIHINFGDDNLIGYILVNCDFLDDDDNFYYFEINSVTLDIHMTYENVDMFLNTIRKKIDKLKNFNYDNINTEKDIIKHLQDYPIFNKEKYNKFVDEVLTKKSYLYKHVNKLFLSDENQKKYKFLELANNFDLI